MSSNVAPPQDDRGFWVRLADSWYGPAASEPFVSPGGREIRGWNPEIASQFAGFPGARPETEGIGYYRLDTGNPTRDAIFSVLINNLGIDNAMRATLARESGDMGWQNYWKEIAGGVAEVSLLGRSTLGVGGYRLLSKGLPSVINLLRRAPVTAPARTVGGLPTLPPTIAAPQGLPSQFGRLMPTAGPTPATVIPGATTRTGPRPITQLRPSQAIDALGNLATRFGNAGWAGVANRLSPSRLPGGRFGLALGALAGAQVLYSGRPGAEARPTATQAAETAAATPSPTGTPPAVPRTIRDVDPIVTATGDALTEAGNDARNDAAAINRQYDNILRELRGMYQLSETNEERERLRFMLADIEAQRNAGLEAIAQGYAQTVAAIQQRAEISRQQTAERAARFGGQLNEYADQTAQRMMLQNLQQQQEFRGLGSGSQTPVNEWVGLMSAMAPIQQQYIQRMGDITGEGIDWLAGTVGAQGQAQSADLQRLAAATRSASIMSHQRQVADRIQRERDALRGSILQTERDRMNALGQVGANILDPFDRQRLIEDYAHNMGFGPGYIGNVLRQAGQGALTPAELAQIEMLNQRHLALDPANAAGTPVTPDGN